MSDVIFKKSRCPDKLCVEKECWFGGAADIELSEHKNIEPKPHTENRRATNCAVCLHGNANVTRGYLYTLSSAEAANHSTRRFLFFERTSKIAAGDKKMRLAGQKVQRRKKF